MFTGIVKCETQISKLIDTDYGKRLSIVLPAELAQGVEVGASVAINGACLTIVAFNDANGDDNQVELNFDVIVETLRLTNLAELSVGDWVNVERAAKFGDEIGGHNLSGHVHGLAEVKQVLEQGGEYAIELSTPTKWHKYIFHKGYVGLNGCSLTIGKVDNGNFWIHLIPETLNITNFDKLKLADKVNLEIDTLTQTTVDTVERFLAQRQS